MHQHVAENRIRKIPPAGRLGSKDACLDLQPGQDALLAFKAPLLPMGNNKRCESKSEAEAAALSDDPAFLDTLSLIRPSALSSTPPPKKFLSGDSKGTGGAP